MQLPVLEVHLLPPQLNLASVDHQSDLQWVEPQLNLVYHQAAQPADLLSVQLLAALWEIHV